VAVALVTGCAGQTQPREYNAAYEANLMFGCTGVQPNADGEYEDPTLAPVSYCECLYDGLKEKVPFKDAEEFEKQQAEDEAGEIEVPKDIQAVYDDCAKER
jgi:hypothetical protein